MKIIFKDGKTVEADFTFDSKTNTLRIDANGESIPDTKPDQPNVPDPKPVDPMPVNGAKLAYEITKLMEQDRHVEIPATGIISSKFTSPEKGYGSFNFETNVKDGGYVTTRIWISEVAGGHAISTKAIKEKSMLYNMHWIVGDSHRTKITLQPNKVYYLNMQHVDPQKVKSSVRRFVSHMGG